MRTIAEGTILGPLADTEPFRSGFSSLVPDRSKRRAFVRAVAEGLLLTQAACTPPVALATLNSHFNGRL